MTNWQLVEHGGKLAVTLGWSPDFDAPQERRDLWVSPREKWDEDYYSQFTQVWLAGTGNNTFRCFSSRTYDTKLLFTTGWPHVQEVREVKPPRESKNYRYEWSGGRWLKVLK